MSKPSPKVYERERGMDAHSKVMRGVRSQEQKTYDPHEPTRVWIGEDNTPDNVYNSLTITLNTGGCRWARADGCTMCDYVAGLVEGGIIAHETLMDQIQVCLDHEAEEMDNGEKAGLIRVYTSGSFLDEREAPAEAQDAIAETFTNHDRMAVESLPDFVTRERLADFTDRGLDTDVAIGLEAATDRVRRDCVNKYFDFADFEDAYEEAAAAGDGVKTYLPVRPPFLSKSKTLDDMKSSIRRYAAADNCHTVSMNPTNVQRCTVVDELSFNSGYRPPWFWSVAEALSRTVNVDTIVVSDPIGGGQERGVHNYGNCGEPVFKTVKDFNLRQDPSVFDQVSCDCEATWKFVLDNETSYDMSLVK